MKNGIMTKEMLKKYVFDRRLHRDPIIAEDQIVNSKGVVIHNAEKKPFVERMFKRAGLQYIPYKPLLSTEPHFYIQQTGETHVVNTRGLNRLTRDEDLTDGLSQVLDRDIFLRVHHFEGDAAKASQRFKQFAFETVERSFDTLDLAILSKHENLYVMMGPHKALSLPTTAIKHRHADEYLNFNTLAFENKQVIHFNYIFADQAQNILEQLYLHMDAKLPRANLHVFHYGKIGILRNGQVGTVGIPYSAMDESEVLQGKQTIYPVNNEIITDPMIHSIFQNHLNETLVQGTTVNTNSVLKQTYAGLEKLAEMGCSFIEMEWLLLASTMKSAYPHLG